MALRAAGGLDALQAVIIVAALPFAILLVAVIVALNRVLNQERVRIEGEERELHPAEQRWLQREKGSASAAPPAPPQQHR